MNMMKMRTARRQSLANAGASLRRRRRWWADGDDATTDGADSVEKAEPSKPKSPTPDEAQKTDTGEQDKQEKSENPVPYTRFKEINEAKKAAEARAAELESRLSKIETDAKKAEEEKLVEQQQWQTLAEQRAKDLEDMKAQIESQRLETMRVRVGAELGLPGPLVDRLRGDDEDAIREDAQALLDALPKPAAPSAERNADNRRPTPNPTGEPNEKSSRYSQRNKTGTSAFQKREGGLRIGVGTGDSFRFGSKE